MLGEQDSREERVMMGLRMVEGIPECDLEFYDNKIRNLVDIRLLERADGRVRTTPAGKPLLNAILRELLA